jgi:RNA polymerase sigma-70 factor (ECF subfamily)
MSEQDDLLLIRNVLKGDRSAFEAIVDKYEKTIFNLALRMTNSYEDAQDITQSVFVKAFEKLHGFNPKHKFFSWLYRIAVNESLNVVKQRKPFEPLNMDLVSKERTPDQNFHRAEIARSIQKALMDLKPHYRVVIVLRHFNDLSYEEISHVVGVPVKVVKSRLFTARKMLKDLLIQHGIKADD